MPQKVIVAREILAVERARHRVEDLVGAERLEHEIGDARAQRLDRGIEIGIGGNQDGLGERPYPALFLEPVEPDLLGHDIVEDHKVDMPLIQQLARLGAGARRLDVAAARAQRLHQEIAHPRLVVDHEERRRCEAFAVRVAGRFGAGGGGRDYLEGLSSLTLSPARLTSAV